MKLYYVIIAVLAISVFGCEKKSKPNEAEKLAQNTHITLPDAIEKRVNALEADLNVRMDRRRYDLSDGTVVQIQKFFPGIDTLTPIKVREIKQGKDGTHAIVYYLENDRVYFIHDYNDLTYNPFFKTMSTDEVKYYFQDSKLQSAVKREAISPDGKSSPVITNVPFSTFTPSDSLLKIKENHLSEINEKFATLPKIIKK
jgi:hypothetical protein